MPTSSAGAETPAHAPSTPPGIEGAFAELGRLMLDQPLGQYLQRVAELAAGTLPGVDGLSVTLVEDGRARSAAFTTTVAAQLDERQYEVGFGPCLDAAQSGDTIRVDVAADDVYPAFARAAARLGVRCAASVGMPVPHRVVGALNLYSASGDLDEETLVLARTFASYAAVALANASLYGSTARLADQLQEAMRSRAVIEQAKGVLMAVHGVDADEAFARLSRASQDANRKLRDMAGEVVARVRQGEVVG
ncbi:GAF and ANTAR domain-containing protein [Pseudokineococcus marinus]|uniref:GAF and ANTAR domain-containing protein n=1 Tax=Pseudokineococcus marinus TaxID=351215 RepID=A0A849BRJ9_9ACTN|nr:GAF and ANTAR domain-containing protein [Pseudokineococcus marinus]NNH23627.1 GAF and ANTAR domain-containing protein [Pseudokineococcus marinus]